MIDFVEVLKLLEKNIDLIPPPFLPMVGIGLDTLLNEIKKAENL